MAPGLSLTPLSKVSISSSAPGSRPMEMRPSSSISSSSIAASTSSSISTSAAAPPSSRVSAAISSSSSRPAQIFVRTSRAVTMVDRLRSIRSRATSEVDLWSVLAFLSRILTSDGYSSVSSLFGCFIIAPYNFLDQFIDAGANIFQLDIQQAVDKGQNRARSQRINADLFVRP